MSKPSGGSAQPPSSIPMPRSKRGLKAFLGDLSREMKKVHWPPYRETNRLTGVVMAVCLLLVLILATMHTVVHQVILVITRGF